MAKSYGHNSYVGWKKENIWGIYENPVVYFPILPGANLKDNIPMLVRNSELRHSRFPMTPLVGGKMAEGGFKMNAYPNKIGYLFSNIFGDSVSTLVAAGVYDHVFEPGIAQSNSASVELQIGSTNPRNYAGFKIKSLTFSNDNAGILMVEVAGGSKVSDEGVTDAVTYVETIPFVFHHAAVSLAGDSRYLDSVNLVIDNMIKLDEFKVGAGQNIQEQDISGMYKITGDFVLDHETWVDFDAHAAQTDVAVTITYTSAEVITAAYVYTLTITLPKVRYENPVPDAAEDRIKETIPFEAFAGTVGASTVPISITLRDAAASY